MSHEAGWGGEQAGNCTGCGSEGVKKKNQQLKVVMSSGNFDCL